MEELLSAKPVYLDYNATTPVDPRVVEAIPGWLDEEFGNPSSTHLFGRRARAALDQAREEVAALICAQPDEIIFTGSATEANNLALLGLADALAGAGRHLVISAVEHPSVAEPARRLEARGWRVTRVPVDREGRLVVEALEAALTADTALVSVMYANNETGTLQPIEAVSALTRERGILLHVDAAQAPGRVPLDVNAPQVDLLTLAGHKFHAPKGVGALYVRRGVQPAPLLHGGGQERGLRPGTENLAWIRALGLAAILAREAVAHEAVHLLAMRDRLHRLLLQGVPGLALNGHPELRLPNTLNVSFPGVQGRILLARVGHLVAASTGSACHGDGEEKGVLAAMGLSGERIRGAVRLSVGRFTTNQEVDRAAQVLIQAWREAVGRHAGAVL